MGEQMQSALAKMLAKAQKTPADYAKNSKVGGLIRKNGVQKSDDLLRILCLPRRKWQDDDELTELVEKITDWLKTPTGTMKLRPVQAKSLEEMHDFKGLVAPIRVGGGKTLVSMIAPVVVGSKRPLLLVPAKLKGKTEREFIELRKHWLFSPYLKVLSYEVISRDGGWDLLETIAPDLIIADEAHRLKNRQAGVTRKVERWMKEHPDTLFCAMSGTITTRSLRDYAHLTKWALESMSPMPHKYAELSDWCDALDEKVDPLKRLMPGALLGLCSDEELDIVAKDPNQATEITRKAFRRRLVETPGVVATKEKALGVSLSIQAHKLEPVQDWPDLVQKMRETYETPDGQPFTEAVELWRHCRELAVGMYYKWDPPAPADWLLARRNWGRFVREVLKGKRKGLDTEFQIAKACARNELACDDYTPWVSIRDSFKPNSVPVWVHGETVKWCKKWMQENEGIVWVEHVAFGKKLSELSGIQYFGEGGTCNGVPIEDASGPIIASIASNHEGRNLQKWNRNLIVSAPPNGRMFEQLLGRTHREGQEADEVSVDILFVMREQWEGFNQAILDAQYIEFTTGQPQKLLYADRDLITADQAAKYLLAGEILWI